jgi:hypothetical protein
LLLFSFLKKHSAVVSSEQQSRAQMKPLTFGVAKMSDDQTQQTKPYVPFDEHTVVPASLQLARDAGVDTSDIRLGDYETMNSFYEEFKQTGLGKQIVQQSQGVGLDFSQQILEARGILKFFEHKVSAAQLRRYYGGGYSKIKLCFTEAGAKHISQVLLDEVQGGALTVKDLIDNPLIDTDEEGYTVAIALGEAAAFINKYHLIDGVHY